MHLKQLRDKHPVIHYLKFDYSLSSNRLKINYQFLLEPNIVFRPKLSISFPQPIGSVSTDFLTNAVFHLGLVELISYYKAAAPKQIIIHPFHLPYKAVVFWRQLLLHGLSEYIYLNQLKPADITASKFKFRPTAPSLPKPLTNHHFQSNQLLLPLGGGKDSAVALSLLDPDYHNQLIPFFLNPIKPATDLANHFKIKKGIVALRTIDPQLLTLNRQGYLNGHTPFSAYLAFLTTITAALSGSKQIIVSNERSANQPATQLGNLPINHQYSKSYQFETNFRNYIDQFLISQLNYFSFLRPLYDLQIANLYAQRPQLLPITNSCNRYAKLGTWCRRCAKCLFVYLSLSAFLPSGKLISIFGSNLLDDSKFKPLYLQLIDPNRPGPLDCVGTSTESIAASQLAITLYRQQGQALPKLLTTFTHFHPHLSQNQAIAKKIMSAYSTQHHLPRSLNTLLKSATQTL